METADVVVAGCGLVGLAVARRLALDGLTVVALDAGTAGGGASGASFGWANASTKLAHERYHRLNAAGVRRLAGLAADVGRDAIGLGGRGSLQPASGAAADRLRAAAAVLTGWGYSARVLAPAELAARWAALALGPDTHALFAPADRWVDPARLSAWLAADLARRGGTVRERAPVTGVRTGARSAVAATPTGPIDAGRLVVAAGEATPALAAMAAGDPSLAGRFPVRVVPGLLVEVGAPPGAAGFDVVVWWADQEGFHLRPAAPGRLLLGAEDVDAGLGGAPVEDGVAALVARAAAVVAGLDPARAAAGAGWRVGRRPVPADGHPIVGALAAAPAVTVAVTHSGVSLALELAEVVYAQVVHGAGPEAWLAPARFGL
jgi:glycine/D-amino acid oxidase-like deaminating enzyme